MPRIALIAARIAAAAFGLYVASFMHETFPHGKPSVAGAFTAAFLLIEATIVLLAFWFAIAGGRSGERRIIGRVLTVGVIVGGISFAGGFFGPMIFMPGANQGPLFGIMFTGPLGFALGCIASFIWLRIRGSRSAVAL
jgi:hypothetical protein